MSLRTFKIDIKLQYGLAGAAKINVALNLAARASHVKLAAFYENLSTFRATVQRVRFLPLAGPVGVHAVVIGIGNHCKCVGHVRYIDTGAKNAIFGRAGRRRGGSG